MNERELLRIAGRAAKLGAWTVTLPERLLTWSEVTADIHDEAHGSAHPLAKSLAYYEPGHRESIAAAFELCASEGVAFDLESRIVTAKGRRIWVRTIGEAVRDETGRVVRVQGACQDITESKNAGEHIRRLADRLYGTLENLTDGFYTLDADWRFEYINPAAEKVLRCPRAGLLGRSVWETFPEAVGTSFERGFRLAAAEGRPVTIEEYYPPFERWFEVRAYPSADGLAVNIRDTTAMRLAREALKASEERFRLLSKATNDAVWDWDMLTDSVWRNEGFVTLFGFPRLEDPSLAPWRERVHPEDLPRVEALQRRAREESSPLWSAEYRFRRADGAYAHVLDRWFVIRDAAGRAQRMVGGICDLTERKAAEDRLRRQAALLDAATDAILVRGIDHAIGYWNASAERIYGWSSPEAVGRSARDLLYDDPAGFDAATAAVLSEGGWSGRIEQRRKDGGRVTVDARWTLLRDAQGRPESVLAINTALEPRGPASAPQD